MWISTTPLFLKVLGCFFQASSTTNEDPIYYDVLGVIICDIGARYNSYYANVSWTYLIDANALQSKSYKAFQKAHKVSLNALKPRSPNSAA